MGLVSLSGRRPARPKMARKVVSGREAATKPLLAMGLIVALLGVGAFGFSTLFGSPGQARASASPAVAAAPPGSPVKTRKPASNGAGSGVKPRTTSLARTTPTPKPASAAPNRVPTETPRPSETSAPNRPADFDLESQAIDIAFPLRAETRYSYRDSWLDARDGDPEAYNHARVNSAGEQVRLHDGIDIYAAQGEPLVAPFAGTVVDPSTRWTPWIASRYGRTVVIVSDERNSRGYVAVMAHAADVWVLPGDHVTRGQVVGTVGQTGNAEIDGTRAYLHFELRAPFLVDWTPVGEERQTDAFNPFPSLLEADSKHV
jgi:murein DD-endopeptidase MepM/ murein hydrolase activator NlpD